MAIKIQNSTIIDDSRNIINAGVVTAQSFVGNLTGTATTATFLSNAANITTGTISTDRLSGTYNINITGFANQVTYTTYADIAGISTFSGISTSVIGGIASVTNLTVSGVSTFSSNVGIKTDNPTAALYVVGDTYITGILTANRIFSNVYGEFTGGGISGTNIVGTALSISGISTLGVTSVTQLTAQSIDVSGITTSIGGFVGNLTGTASTASFATTAFNLTDAANITTGTIDTARLTGTYNIDISGNAATATNAGIATYADTSGISTISGYATNAGVATYATSSGIATYATSSGIATYADVAGIATALQNARTFEITGDVVASAISFDGTGNVSLAATIQPNSVALGNDTTGNYVTSITNGSYITGADGGSEGSILTIGVAATSTNTANQIVARDASGNFSASTITANLTGTATTATNLADAANITTGTISTSRLTGTYNIDISGNAATATYAINVGISTYADIAGIATYAINAGVSTSVIGGIASVTNLTVSGITTLGITSSTQLTTQSVNSSGIVTGSSFRPSTGYYQSANGTNSFFVYDGTGNVAFQGTIGASQVNNASGFKVIGFAGTDITFENNAYVAGITTSIGGFVGNLTGTASTASFATTAFNLADAANITTGTISTSRLSGTYNIDISGNAATATNAGVATALQNSRTFEITGDVVASAISFDGTGNVSLAATIQPNSVGLGTDTFGDYVTNITGTSNQITVTSGTGEGSTPTLSLPTNLVVPEDLTVTRDLQVNRNLNVNGNITIGGTTAFVNVQELTVFDPDIVLGYRTDAFGNDSSNDNTANHGGVAVASTEGTPLVDLFIAGIETNPSTYKKIMWFKEGTFAGLGTDAWLINYAVGIGSTQFPNGTRLAAGSVQFTENDVSVVRNINASGIITAPQFIGTASTSSFATTAFNLADAANITTGTINSSRLSGTYNIDISGNAAKATNAGVATYAVNAGVSTSVIGGIASVTNLTVSGISTFNNDVYVGSGITFYASSGIVSATAFYGSGLNLTDVVSSLVLNKLDGITVLEEGSIVGTADSIKNLNFVGSYVTATGIGSTATITFTTPPYSDVAGIATYATTAGIATYATTAGIATYATNAGIATYATTAGIATSVINNPGVGIATAGGTVGTGATILDFRGSGISTVTVSAGIATINIIDTSGGGGGTIGIASTTQNATHYIGFTSITTGDLSTLNISDTGLTFNPSTGNLIAGGTVTANSDEKLKTNIKTIENALDKVLSLRGVEYDRTDTGDHQLGVIAQEVERVIPEVVYPKSAPDYETKSVAYGNIIGLLIEAIKEQNQKIAELERKLGEG